MMLEKAKKIKMSINQTWRKQKDQKLKQKKTTKNVLYNTETLYKARSMVIKFCEEYFLRISEAKVKPTNGKEFNEFLRV